MRVSTIRISTLALASFLLLAAGVFATGTANAARVNADLTLPGIAPQGYASFTFDVGATAGGLAGTINSWYSNLFYIGRSQNGITYDLVASTSGLFRFYESEDVWYRGVNGQQTLTARFGSGGRLLGGQLEIKGRIKDLGILNANTTLVRADIKSVNFRGSLVGFAIDNIWCADEIKNCQDNPAIAESVYMRLRQQFPDIRALGNGIFVTNIRANTTTVPVPAAVWLFLSGIGMLGAQAAHRRRRELRGKG